MLKRLAMAWTLIVGVATSFGSGAPMLLCVGADNHIDLQSVARNGARACPASLGERHPARSAAPTTAVDSSKCCLDVPVAIGVSILADLPSSRLSVTRVSLQACPVIGLQVDLPSPYASSMPADAATEPLYHCPLCTVVLLI